MSLLAKIRTFLAGAPEGQGSAGRQVDLDRPRLRHVQCLGPNGLHRMAYAEWGDPDNPRVLVCVHGLTRNGRDFDYLARALSGRYRVVCPDVVGRGRSDWLAEKGDYQFPTYVADMVTLLARLDVESVHWVGTSMGGIIGMLLSALPNTPVSRLVLNDVGPVITVNSLRRIGEYVGNAPGFASIQEAEQYIRAVSEPFGPLSDEHWRHLAECSVKPAEGG
ncbi:MAG: alpha/beta fold hydrolase, partial [Zoogloea sp.]|nr:alpha/beta fold hydrolase [Zoogloea sp.]